MSAEKSDDNMAGRTCIVTGANSGIGLVTAKALASQGAQVALFCRSMERGQAAAEEVGGGAWAVQCDFSKPASIARAAQAFRDQRDRLDVLVCNHGAYFPNRSENHHGWEMNFAVNHMGYFLLTRHLLPQLQASAPSRVVVVASIAHHQGEVDLDDLQHERRVYRGLPVYANSKLMNVLFTRELARRLEGTGVTANCLHPGTFRSGFGQDEPGLLSRLIRIAAPFMKSPEKAAKTSIYLATSAEVEGNSGQYFENCRVRTPGRTAQDDELARRLWETSEQLAGDLEEAS